MLEPHGRQILELIGKEPSPQGILQVADLEQAIDTLESAVRAHQARRAQAEREAQQRGEDTAHDDSISLSQRATPFLAMMRRCLSESHDIVWGV